MSNNHSSTVLSNKLLLKKRPSQKFLKVRQAHQRELLDDYIELVADLIRENGEARQIDLALRLGVSQPTVSKKIKQLITKNLIQQRPYHSLFLTEKGKQLAYKNQKKHKIVESFLLALGVSPQIAYQDAEGIEHHVSHETLLIFICFLKNTNNHYKSYY